MEDLASFGTEGDTDLSSFSAPPAEKSVKSDSSDKVVAAQGAYIDGTEEELLNTFNKLSGLAPAEREMEMGIITDRVYQENVRASQDIAAQMLLNPDISQEESERIVRSISGIAKPNSMDMMSAQLGVKDSGNEDPVSEDIRLDAVNLSAEVNGSLRERQALLNGELLSTNPGGWNALGDFFQAMIPMDESLVMEEVVRKIRGGSVGSAVEAFTLLGNAKVDMIAYRDKLTHQEQREFDRTLAEVLNSSEGIIFTNDNDLMQKDIFMSIVDGTYYGTADQVLDNVISVLDLVGLGGLLRSTKLGLKTSQLTKSVTRKMRAKVQPASPAKVAAEVNPEEARKLQAVAEADPTDETAMVTHGTTREEVVVDAEAPQVSTPDGSVESKPNYLDKFVERFTKSGKIDLEIHEIKAAQDLLVDRVQQVNGITNRKNMAQYKAAETAEDGTVTFQNVYGPADSSYKTPQEGIDNVLFALRDYGVDESDLTILRKVGDEYVPTTLKEVEAKRVIREELVSKKKKLPDEFKKANMRDDYLIRVNFEHDFDPMDIDWDVLQVKRNFFDRFSFFNKANKGSSSLQRNLLDIHSMLDPRLTLGANVAVEKASALETALIKNADAFIQPFKKLDGERQTALIEVIKNDNYTGTRTPYRTLRAQGYTPEEIEILAKWKEAWDQLYHLENMDLVKSLKAAGYQRFIDESNGGTELIARSVGTISANKVRKVYDSSTGKVRSISDKEIKELYEGGGTLAELKTTEKVGGKDVDHVLVKNEQNKSMLRDLQDSDRVLNYREGYYTVRYKDPHIITKEFLDERGDVVRTQAVGTAGTVKEAKLAKANKNRGNAEVGVRYSYRDNRDRTVGQMQDDAWEIHSSTGRTSQKIRGERLGTSDTNLQNNAMGAVEGPADALLNSIRSISRRTSMRDYIERYKQRFLSNYGELIETDTKSGRKAFPRSTADFKTNLPSSDKMVADARTNLEYINYLESGYRNGLDDGWKALLNGMADNMGKNSAFAEKVVRATADEIGNPTQWTKARAFDAYLALNPLRQFVVQGHQSSLLAANFTKYVLSQRLARDMAAVHMAMLMPNKLHKIKGIEKLLGMKVDDALKLADEYRATGFEASIDRNNLVESGLDHLVETSNYKTIEGAKKGYRAVVGKSRQWGFDAGERINIMSAWLAHRNKALEQGKDITSIRVQDEIVAKSRNYTYNMNSAGDMPYNKNALALLFQFMQVPHKAMTQVLFNRALSAKEKTKLGLYNALMLPVPVGLGYTIISGLDIEDENLRDFVANGIEGLVANKAAQLMLDDDTRVDISSLASVDPNAPYDLIMGFLTMDAGEILANSPSLSLWTGYNPRMTNILTETYKFVSEPKDISAESSLELMQTFASYSSGYMNLSKGFRELFVQEYDRRYNSSMMITDSSITTPEKVAQILGFGSKNEAYARQTKKELYEKSQEARDDVKAIYLAQKQAGFRKGLNIDSPEAHQHMLRAFWSATDFTVGQQKEYMSLLARDIEKGDDGVLGLILQNLNYVSAEEIMEAAQGAGVTDQVGEIIQMIMETERMGDADE